MIYKRAEIKINSLCVSELDIFIVIAACVAAYRLIYNNTTNTIKLPKQLALLLNAATHKNLPTN